MKVFTNCAEKYQVTPMKNKLTSKFIESENAQALQQLMDISIKVHGEMNSLYDLVFSFLECGRVRQAKKVLEVSLLDKVCYPVFRSYLGVFTPHQTDSRSSSPYRSLGTRLQALRGGKAHH